MKRLNQSGTSMVEMLTAMAILGGVIAGFMKVQTMFSDITNKTNRDFAITTIMQDIKVNLRNKEACAQTFNGISIDGGEVPPDAPRGLLNHAGARLQWQKGLVTAIDNGRLTIDLIQMRNYNDARKDAVLNVRFIETAGVAGASDTNTYIREIGVRASSSNGATIDDCVDMSDMVKTAFVDRLCTDMEGTVNVDGNCINVYAITRNKVREILCKDMLGQSIVTRTGTGTAADPYLYPDNPCTTFDNDRFNSDSTTCPGGNPFVTSGNFDPTGTTGLVCGTVTGSGNAVVSF
jgi:hypothetical protein